MRRIHLSREAEIWVKSGSPPPVTRPAFGLVGERLGARTTLIREGIESRKIKPD